MNKKQDFEIWPGRWFVTVLKETELGTAHIHLFRFMQDHERGALFAELGRPYPEDPYEASCVEESFNAEEVEAIKRYFAEIPQTEVVTEPALKPAPGWSGMAATGDMYCGMVQYPEIPISFGAPVQGTISHYVTPDKNHLTWDETLAEYTVDKAVGMVTGGGTDKERAFRELEEKRQETRRKLQDMIDGNA